MLAVVAVESTNQNFMPKKQTKHIIMKNNRPSHLKPRTYCREL
jgi:hypothetical protein